MHPMAMAAPVCAQAAAHAGAYLCARNACRLTAHKTPTHGANFGCFAAAASAAAGLAPPTCSLPSPQLRIPLQGQSTSMHTDVVSYPWRQGLAASMPVLRQKHTRRGVYNALACHPACTARAASSCDSTFWVQ